MLAGHNAIATGTGIDAVRVSGRGTIERDPESHRLAVGRGKYQMKIASMKSIGDGGARLLRCRLLRADSPCAGEAPLVQTRPTVRIRFRSVLDDAPRRDKAFGALVADVCFRRLVIAFRRRRLRARRMHRDDTPWHAGSSRFGEQLLDHFLRFIVAALAEVMVADAALRHRRSSAPASS